jgi:hypothetical protein
VTAEDPLEVAADCLILHQSIHPLSIFVKPRDACSPAVEGNPGEDKWLEAVMRRTVSPFQRPCEPARYQPLSVTVEIAIPVDLNSVCDPTISKQFAASHKAFLLINTLINIASTQAWRNQAGLPPQ